MSSGVRWAIVFLFPRFSLATFSINSLQLLLSVAIVLHSTPTLSSSQQVQFFHRVLGLPRLLLPSTFCASDLFARLFSPTFPMHKPVHFNILLTNILLLSNLHSQLIYSSLIRSPHSRDYSYPVVFANLIFSCCFTVDGIVSKPHMYTGATDEVSTFPLSLRDIRLSPITRSTFLQAFPPAVSLLRIFVFSSSYITFTSTAYYLDYLMYLPYYVLAFFLCGLQILIVKM